MASKNNMEVLVDILKYRIIKQSNGKFALWNAEDYEFIFTNFETPDDIKKYFINKVDLILTENILDYAQDDTWFKLCVEEYKKKYGIENPQQIEAIDTLNEMGVSVDASGKQPENFLRFIRSIVCTSGGFDDCCSAFRFLFITGMVNKVVISGPGCSGKSLLAGLIREISVKFSRDFEISVTTSDSKDRFCKIISDTLFFNLKKTIDREAVDPYLYQKIITELPEIVDWVKYRGL